MPSDLTLSRSTWNSICGMRGSKPLYTKPISGRLRASARRPWRTRDNSAVSAPPRFCSTKVKPPAVLKPRMGGRLRPSTCVALILRWHQARRTVHDQAPDCDQQCAESQHHDDGVALHHRHAPDIAVARALEQAIELGEEPAERPMPRMGFFHRYQQQRAHRGRE